MAISETERPVLDTERQVLERYAGAAQERESALCCPVQYDAKFLAAIPQEILDKDYGCGDPSRYVREGDVVLDLGSGGGKICYIASQAVGPKGRVIGVDFNPAMLALAGKLFVKDGLAREGAAGFARRSDHMGVGLIGRTLGSIGIGNIGAEMFRLFAPLGMRFIAHDPYVSEADAAALGVTLVDLDTLFRDSDFLTVNLPLTPETEKLVDARRLALMKPSAYLINTSRGPIVDPAALVAALSAGAIAGAGIDVFDPEPPSPDDPLLGLDNVVLSPHLAWLTPETIERSIVVAAENCRRLARGEPLLHREIDRIVAAWCATRERWEITRHLQAAGVPAYPSQSNKDLTEDPHLVARDYFTRLPHPEVGTRIHPGIPWKLRHARNGVRSPAPCLGADTDAVLSELLGKSVDELQQLRDREVLV